MAQGPKAIFMALDALSQTSRRAWFAVFWFGCMIGACELAQTSPSVTPATSATSNDGEPRLGVIRISHINFGVERNYTTGLDANQNLVFACHWAVYYRFYRGGSQCI
jgi:hypothetical protein